MEAYIQVIRYLVFIHARTMVFIATSDQNDFLGIDNLKTKHINVLAIQLPCKKLFSSHLGYKKLW